MVDMSEADTAEHFLRPEEGRRKETNSALVRIDLGARSDRGKVRANNEDHFLAARFERSMRTLATSLPPGDVPEGYAEAVYGLMVADGMGGHAAGEVASRTAIGALVDMVLQTPDWIMRIDEELAAKVLARFEQRFMQLRDALIARAVEDPSLAGMGTTMTLACSLAEDLIIIHSGDSRAYLFRQDLLRRLTHDQTMAQSLADSGKIKPEEVASHPMRHVLTGAIATRGDTERAELRHYRLKDGDQLLLCTDGLTEMVTEEAISETLRAPGTADEACGKLVEQALAAGGRDNVTVVLVRYSIPEAPEPPARESQSSAASKPASGAPKSANSGF